MTKREIIDRVTSLYNKGAATDDSRLSKRHVYSKIVSARSFLLNREVNKNKRISERNIEYLECVPLSKAPIHECPCIPPLGCDILKTDCIIPKFLSSSKGDHIVSVTSLDGSYTFSPTTFESKKYKQFNKYTSGVLDYFIKNGYMYVTAKEELPAITIGGVFEDTSKFNCNHCAEGLNNCKTPLDEEFRIDSYLIEPIISLAVEELIKVFSQMPEDKLNDAKDK